MKHANRIEYSRDTAGARRPRPKTGEMGKIAAVFLAAVICGLGAGCFIGLGW